MKLKNQKQDTYFLRDYQYQAVIDTLEKNNYPSFGNPLIVLPPGTGKSWVIAGLVNYIYYAAQGQRVLIATDRKELIEQDYEKINLFCPEIPCGVYSAALNKKQYNLPVIIGGVQTIVNGLNKLGKFNILIIDECDLVSPKDNTSYRKIIDYQLNINPYFKVIGTTATPYRMDNGLLTNGPIFTHITYSKNKPEDFLWFIEQGYLVPLIAKKGCVQINTKGIRKSGGDYNNKELQAVSDKEEITRKALDFVIANSTDRKCWLVFSTGTAHTQHICEYLTKKGIKSRAIFSGMKNRSKYIEEARTGECRALVSRDICLRGFDLPQIDLLICLRPTESARVWVQGLGRGTRPAPDKKDCLVYDFTDNSARIGAINNPTIISKEKICKNKKCNTINRSGAKACKKCGYQFPEVEAPQKACPKCDTFNATSARTCYDCGFEFEFEHHLKKVSSGKDLLDMASPNIVSKTITCTGIFYERKITKLGGYAIRANISYTDKNFYKFVWVWFILKGKGLLYLRTQKWWSLLPTKHPLPDSVDLALSILATLPQPKKCVLGYNKKTKYYHIEDLIY
jgi:DNA repair protein RadD